MAEKNLRLHDWMEPAHPMIIKLHDDLLVIYRLLRDTYQKQIDQAFDDVSRKIGFVVTTTVPVVVEIGDKGVIKNIAVGSENLKGTLFESALIGGALGKLKDGSIPRVSAGTYSLYLLWFDALRLKLKTDWMEPAHFRKPMFTSQVQTNVQFAVKPEVMEPAHWFNPQVVLQPEETVLIAVIDEVYPELNLAARVSAYRDRLRVRPEVMEPAHFRVKEIEQLKDNPAELLKMVKQLLEKYS